MPPGRMHPDTPVLIGVGQVTVRDEPLDALSSPMDLMERAALAAADDAHLPATALADVDSLAVVRSFREPMRNSPDVLARRIGADRSRQWITPDGGQAPQALVNLFSDRIARGETRLVLLAGAEAMDNGRRLIKSGTRPDWAEPSESDPELIFVDRPMWTAHEKAHGIWLAAHVYPLFENALRGLYGHSIEAHQRSMGELLAPFSATAAQSPHAWFPVARSAAEIATSGPANRFVGWPYTKFMNAMNQINQSAALLLTSVRQATAMGVPTDRWVYLHGCADTTELWGITDRANYHSAPSLKVMGERALAMAGLSIDAIDLFDLYSCFPSAIALARDALGIGLDDPRPLTVTGGLPFHGGAGNNYSMNAIAAMADTLRADPGKFGMVTANGGYLGKQAGGIYAAAPSPNGAQPWRREDPAIYQRRIDALAHPPFAAEADGPACIETYTVTFNRDNEPESGIVIGRMGDDKDPAAARFVANVPADPALLHAMTTEDFLGRHGRVRTLDRRNVFTPY